MLTKIPLDNEFEFRALCGAGRSQQLRVVRQPFFCFCFFFKKKEKTQVLYLFNFC